MPISKNSCIRALRDAADKLGHAPTVDEYKELDLSPSYNTIIARCGSWSAAIEELDAERKSRKVYSDEECLDGLREAAEELGEEPSMQQYRQLDIKPAGSTIVVRFGSWNEAKEAAAVLETS